MWRDLALNPGRNVVENDGTKRRDKLIFGWLGFALAGLKQVVECGVGLQRDARRFECLPAFEIFHRHLIVAFALEDEHWHRESVRGGHGLIRIEVLAVGFRAS